MKQITTLVFSFFALSTPLTAYDLYVPSEFSTVQEAVDAAEPGDRILIAPGEYVINDETIEVATSKLSFIGGMAPRGRVSGSTIFKIEELHGRSFIFRFHKNLDSKEWSLLQDIDFLMTAEGRDIPSLPWTIKTAIESRQPLRVLNCHFRDEVIDGPNAFNPAYNPVLYGLLVYADLIMDGCSMNGISNGVSIWHGLGNAEFKNCLFQHGGGRAITSPWIYNEEKPHNIVIDSCHFADQKAGLYLKCSEVSVTNCHFSDIGATALEVWSDLGGYYSWLSNWKVLIQGNEFVNCRSGLLYWDNISIGAWEILLGMPQPTGRPDDRSVVIEGNSFENMDSYAAYATPSRQRDKRDENPIYEITMQTDLSDNWWGSKSGPYHDLLNPLGEGEGVVIEFGIYDVLINPWLTAKPR